MAKAPFDGLIEAVRYGADRQVVWARAYLRRGPTFSDRVILDRQRLVESLKAGKKYVFGTRLEFLGSTFNVQGSVRLVQSGGKDILVTDDTSADQDRLEGIPEV